MPAAVVAAILETTAFLAAGAIALDVAPVTFAAGAAVLAGLGAALEAIGAGLGAATAALEAFALVGAGIAAPAGLVTGFGAASRAGLLLPTTAVAADEVLANGALAGAEALAFGAGALRTGACAAFCLGKMAAFGTAVAAGEAVPAGAALPVVTGALGRGALSALFFVAPAAFAPLPVAALGSF